MRENLRNIISSFEILVGIDSLKYLSGRLLAIAFFTAVVAGSLGA
jgi:hypothetical protein